jgi:hypothetical protein
MNIVIRLYIFIYINKNYFTTIGFFSQLLQLVSSLHVESLLELFFSAESISSLIIFSFKSSNSIESQYILSLLIEISSLSFSVFSTIVSI